MAQDATNVRVGVGGVVYHATGEALPGDLVVPPAGFTDLGYVSDDGVTETTDTSTQSIKAWGGDTVRVIQTEHSLQYSFTFIETKPEVLALYYRDTDATELITEITSAQAVRGQWIIDVVDGSELIRIEIPDGEVAETGDVTYATESALGYEMTVECYPDSSGVKAYRRQG